MHKHLPPGHSHKGAYPGGGRGTFNRLGPVYGLGNNFLAMRLFRQESVTTRLFVAPGGRKNHEGSPIKITWFEYAEKMRHASPAPPQRGPAGALPVFRSYRGGEYPYLEERDSKRTSSPHPDSNPSRPRIIFHASERVLGGS